MRNVGENIADIYANSCHRQEKQNVTSPKQKFVSPTKYCNIYTNIKLCLMFYTLRLSIPELLMNAQKSAV